MKKIKAGIKSAALTGLFTLLPILLLYLLLAEIFQLLVAMATPLADLIFPADMLEGIKEEVLLAILILFTASLLVGLLANSIIGKKWGASIERNTVSKIPMYRAVKRLTSGFTDADGDRAFLPGLLNSGEGEQDLVFVIEDHGNGKLTVMLPWAPAAFAGSLKIVDAAKVELVDSNIGEYSKLLSHWGVGLPKVLKK
jgi:uncharacterized membrane protein